MDLDKIHTMYFLGVGGIGMSALARYFLRKGKEIHGYDLTSTPLTTQLQNEGMHIHFEDDISKIPENPDLVIYTPAIPDDNTELKYLMKSAVPILKRAELVGKLSEKFFTIAIAGTHGKTSISAITAHLLRSAGINVTALIGGILNNYNSNLVISEPTDCLIIEADEYDRSFLQLHPNIAVISSMDADHLDIYQNKETLSENFRLFANNLDRDGTMIINRKLEKLIDLPKNTVSYGINKNADIKATNIHVFAGKFVFDLSHDSTTIKEIKLVVPGYHYVENALAAAAVAFRFDLSLEQINTGLESFKGVERRFVQDK